METPISRRRVDLHPRHPPHQLLKRHGDEASYLGEVLAYQLLDAEQVLPELHSTCDATRTLVVDFLDTPAEVDHKDGFTELIAEGGISPTDQ